MSFKRTIQRNHNNQMTHHKEEDKTEFQANFNLTWIPFQINSLLILIAIFIISQFICIPFVANYISYGMALVFIHGLLSSLLVVFAFLFIHKHKISLYGFFLRYSFCVLMFGGFAFALKLLLGM